MYVLIRTTGKQLYVAPEGQKHSYTNKLERARKFSTKEEAERNKCGNERAESVYNIINR